MVDGSSAEAVMALLKFIVDRSTVCERLFIWSMCLHCE